jgi:hypothetical protein
MKCHPQSRVLNAWSPAGTTILGGSETRRQSLLGESRLLGGMLLKVMPGLQSCLLPVCHKVKNVVCYPSCHDILPKCRGPIHSGLNPLKPWTKIDLSSFKLFSGVFWLQLCKSTSTENSVSKLRCAVNWRVHSRFQRLSINFVSNFEADSCWNSNILYILG